MLKINKILY